jgi:ABC-type Zn uptake system ZnuABC Zn-binding protein ZnuA
MQKQNLQNIIKEQSISAPKELKDVVLDFWWMDEIEKIGLKYLLTEEEVYDLQVEMSIYLLGFELKNLKSLIEEIVYIDNDKLEYITKEFEEQITNPILSKLKEKLKEKINKKEPKWYQNVNFVLSNGEYIYFTDEVGTTNKFENPENKKEEKTSSNIEKLKESFTI